MHLKASDHCYRPKSCESKLLAGKQERDKNSGRNVSCTRARPGILWFFLLSPKLQSIHFRVIPVRVTGSPVAALTVAWVHGQKKILDNVDFTKMHLFSASQYINLCLIYSSVCIMDRNSIKTRNGMTFFQSLVITF